MIKLTKLPVPAVLQANAQRWTQEILDKHARGEKPTKTDRSKYNHTEVKSSLVNETNGKCAYCESYIRHIAYGDIEHITPKSAKLELWFAWDNLTLACDVCNTNKGEHENLVDPYDQNDPQNRLLFIGAAVWPMPGDEVADLTIRILDLNRDELFDRRLERIERLMSMLDTVAKTKDPALRQMLKADFQAELEENKEYAAMSRRVSSEVLARIA
jgi:uncharacterized protein (TIGR02646 family)